MSRRPKGKQIPPIPTLTGINDLGLRRVLEPLITGWQLRNTGDLAFVSNDELLSQLATALRGTGERGAAGVSQDELVRGLLKVSSGYSQLESHYDELLKRIERLESKSHEHPPVT